MTDILIIGAGNMGTAIGQGLKLNTDHKVYFKTRKNPYSEFNTLQNPWVFLAVKPYQISDTLRDAASFFAEIQPKAVISVAAGFSLKDLKQNLSDKVPAMRAMPNTPVSTGQGMMGYLAENTHLGDEFKDLCISLGKSYAFDNEDEFHLFTALAGSGPAYLFHMIEALALSASKLGMNAHRAQDISKQLFLGVTTMLPQDTPTQLRKNVTSPNGTTQAGLEQLMNPQLDLKDSQLAALIEKTLSAAMTKSKNY